MTPRDYLAIARREWPLIAVIAILGAGGGWALSATTTPSFSASSSVVFQANYGNSANDLNQGSNYAQSQMLTFAVLATTPEVLDTVVEDLELPLDSRDLARQISVSNPPNTVILEVRASSATATLAADIADATAQSLAETVQDLSPKTEGGNDTIIARVVAPATVPEFASSPNTRLNIASGGLAGLVIGALIAVLLHVLDTRVRSAEALRRETDAPLIGQIDRGASTGDGIVMVTDPVGPIAESFRQLRESLRYVAVGSGNVVLLTSSIQGEGKSVIAANLAVAIAETGSRVVLVDGDLRRPTVAGKMGLGGEAGLTDVLIGAATLADVLLPGPRNALEVLPAGPVPPNPAELLSSQRMRDTIAELSASHDIVLIDSAPVLPVADAVVMSRLVDTVLIVVDSARLRRNQLRNTIDAIEGAGASIAGVVLNRVRRSKDQREYYTRTANDTAAEDARNARLRGAAIAAEASRASAASAPAARDESNLRAPIVLDPAAPASKPAPADQTGDEEPVRDAGSRPVGQRKPRPGRPQPRLTVRKRR